MAASCEHGGEHLGFMKGREFLDWLKILLVSEGICCMELGSYR
jgi:hypothetical protein